MPRILDSSLRETLRNRLEELYPNRLSEAIIFGSYARGEAASNSDLDVLLVLKGPVDRFKERQKLAKLTTDLLISDETYVSIKPVSEEEFEESDWPLIANVRREGIQL